MPAEDGGFKERFQVFEEERPIAADWPPSPPIGQLPAVALWPTWSNGIPVEGERLRAQLYDLLSSRWGLDRDDIFAKLPQRIPEEYILRILFLTLEGRTAKEIVKVLQHYYVKGEKKPIERGVYNIRTTYIQKDLLKLGEHVKLRTGILHQLIFPSFDPKTGEETELSKKIKAIQDELKLEHRAQIFNLASKDLPSLHGLDFNQIDRVIEALHRNIVGHERAVDVQAAIASEYDPKSHLVTHLRNTLLSPLAKERLAEAEGKLSEADAPLMAEFLLSGDTYEDIRNTLAARGAEHDLPVIRTYIHRRGRKVYKKLPPEMQKALTTNEEDWSVQVAAFILYYAQCSPIEATNAAGAVMARMNGEPAKEY